VNLQPVSGSEGQNVGQEEWRNSHIIRFSQIDGAGIVYYPRYFEMLADSFPAAFALQRPASLETSFLHPVRLGERLTLEAESGPALNELRVAGVSGGQTCFQLHKSDLVGLVSPAWQIHGDTFVRQAEIRDWMTASDGRMQIARCYELTAVLMEEWFSVALDCPFATLQSQDGALVPTVKLQTEVNELPSHGDVVQASLVVLTIGRSSLGLGMVVTRGKQLLLQTRQTIVFVEFRNDQLHSVPIPSHLLPTLQRHQVPAIG